ncbi:MAG TPA: type II toxin-antitoxin system RelE/ParE family toxin [Saprospiraceae bacterium]|nr:type II toxin-antitoxin system RelE/ParE family toxin [Saprospiraceae bacterium]
MKIIFTDEAQGQLDELLYYLETEWSPRIRARFLTRLQSFLAIIERMPKAFQATEFPAAENARRCVVVPQVSVYYQIDEANQQIIILTIRDNRMGWN